VIDDPGFDFWQKQKILVFSKMARTAVGFTQGAARLRLNTHLHIARSWVGGEFQM